MHRTAGVKAARAATCAAAWLAAGTCAWAQNWTATKLNGLAVTNAAGAIVVLGTEGSYNDNPAQTKEAAFDGNAATFFDPPSNTVRTTACWAGFELQAPKMVTRVRYLGRVTSPNRMRGVLFQGADTADFADAVTFHTANPPAGWPGTNWVDVTLATTNAFRAFRFLRFIGPNLYGGGTEEGTCAGNAAEVEFYGADLTLDTPPPAPALTFADAVNWRANLNWTVAANALVYEVQRRLTNETAFATVLEDGFRNAGPRIWTDPPFLFGDAAYRIRARNNVADSEWVDIPIRTRNAASGAWFGTQGTYGGGMTGDKLYDGDIATYFDGPSSSGGNNLWSALDLGAPRTVAGLRFMPRATFATRMTGGLFQAADNTNFTDAVTLHTIPSDPPYDTLTEVAVDPPVSARYVRYLSPNGGWGNALEVEFLLSPGAPKAPTGLAAVSSDFTNDHAVLSWAYGTKNLVSSSVVYRATAPGGPYAALTPAGVTGYGWTDTDLVAGVLYYYKVGTLYSDGADVHEGPLSEYVTFRRSERLERTWSDNTTLKAGVTAFRIGTPYQNNPAVDVDKIFDGSIATFADITPLNCIVGVDLGAPCSVTKMRFCPRAANVARVNGAILCGSNDLASAVTLATFAGGAANTHTLVATTNFDAYRYVFATRPSGEFYGNLAELELYGWPAANVADLLTAPAGMTFTPDAAAPLVSWTAGGNAAAYRVERTPADGSGAWESVGTTAGLSLADAAPAWGVRCLYRVASVRPDGQGGEEIARSESFPFTAYAPGSGTGLKGHYFTGYTKAYTPAEALALTRVDAGIDFTWTGGPVVPGVPESATNTLVVWNGRVIVPYDGTYTFYAATDDGIALRVDGAFVVNDWNTGSATRSGSTALAAGEHDIRLDYFQATGGAHVRLEWEGPVARAVIPASQLIPADLPSEDIGPWKGRTFNAPRLGTHAYDAASGGIRITSGGLDLSGVSEGHHFVWQPFRGPFLLEAKVEQHTDAAATSAKALLMVRNALESGSPFLAPARMASTPGKHGCKGRVTPGGTVLDLPVPAWQGEVTNPCWMRLKRVGGTFTMDVRNEGGEWATFFTYEDAAAVFTSDVVVGFSVTSPLLATGGTLPGATFSETRLVPLSGTVLLMR